MSEKRIEILNVRPVHPGRGEPSRIEMAVVLSHLKGGPVVAAVLTPREAVQLIEQLAFAIRAIDQ